tara:strand:- start:734 stop:943 length:210 start_codon:yes stop_codon:yes gene_type:complete
VEHVFEWSHGGEHVEICADFNNWQGESMEKIYTGEPIKVGTGLVVPPGSKNIGQHAQTHTHVFAKLLNP